LVTVNTNPQNIVALDTFHCAFWHIRARINGLVRYLFS
jgi:hypothetical protein